MCQYTQTNCVITQNLVKKMAWRRRGSGRGYSRSGRGFGAAGRGGYGYWARTTGMPGWMRSAYGWPAYGGWGGQGRGNPYPYCRFFPWLPRRWWSGMYGPVQWTRQGPMLSSQTGPTTTGQVPQTPMRTPSMTPYGAPPQAMGSMPSMTPTAPTQQQSVETLRQQKQMLEQQLEGIEETLKDLKESK